MSNDDDNNDNKGNICGMKSNYINMIKKIKNDYTNRYDPIYDYHNGDHDHWDNDENKTDTNTRMKEMLQGKRTNKDMKREEEQEGESEGKYESLRV